MAEIFSDNFNSGAWSAGWDDDSHVDGTDLSVSDTAALGDSAYGLLFNIDDQTDIYLYEGLSAPGSGIVRFRTYFHPHTLTMANNDEFHFLDLVLSGAPWLLVSLRLKYVSGTGYQLVTAVYNDAGILDTNVTTVSDAEHYVEVECVQASGAAANDGTFEVWLDSVSLEDWAGVDVYDAFDDLSYIWYGLDQLDAGTSGTFFMDEFVINDDGNEIGEAGITVAPSALTVVAAVVAPTVVLGSVSVTPTAISAVMASVAPTTVLGSMTVAPAAISAVATVVNPSIASGFWLTPAAITAVASTIAPTTVLGSMTVTPSALTVVTGVVAPTTVLGSMTVTPSALTVVPSTVAPTVVLGSMAVAPTATSVVAITAPTFLFVIGNNLPSISVAPGVRCLVGDTTGRLLAELEVDIGPVSWRLNAIGRAEFTIAQSDAKATEDYLGFGNRVLFQFENGLPDWGGMIDVPRTWNADGTITCTAYSGEYILGTRRTGKTKEFTGSTPGTIFQTLLADANGVEDTGIAAGTIWTGGSAFAVTYHYDDLLQITQDLLIQRLADYDYCIVASKSGGSIVFTANFYQERGSTKAAAALIEGHNAVDVQLAEQGPIVNVWTAVGAGSTWGDERLTGTDSDSASIAAYGRREGHEAHSDLEEQAALTAISDTLVDQYKDPQSILTLSALDKAPALFADYDVGDTVRVWLHSYGFGGYNHLVRVLGREYDPESGRCQLVVKEND